MKHMKKIVSLMLAAVMVLAMTVTVSAQQDVDSKKAGSAEIKITNATVGKKYTLYKVFDATVDDSKADDIKVAYSWPAGKDWTANDYFDKDSKGNITAKDAAFADEAKQQLSEGAITWIESNHDEVDEVIWATAEDQTLVFKNLEYGYYYVESQVGAVVTITSIKPNATIIDKNQEPSWPDNGKTILKDGTAIAPEGENKDIISDGAFGDTVKYQINVNSTNYLGTKKVTQYVIDDTIGTGLTYQTNTLDVGVWVGETETKLETSAYEVKWAEDGRSFKLTIPWIDGDGNFLYEANAVIRVEYDALINENAEIAGEGNEGNKNKATFTYITDDGEPHKDEKEKETTTYTYALGIQKTDENGAPLAGATFTIQNKDGKYLTGELNADGTYNYTGLADSADAATVFETIADGDYKGQLVIKGVTVGEYTITEVEAPAGYNKLTEPKTVEAQRTGATSYKETYTVWYDEDGNVTKEVSEKVSEATYTFPITVSEFTVVNHSGTQLPSTGGIGTTLFYVIGGILVLAAVVLLVTKKRMSSEA